MPLQRSFKYSAGEGGKTIKQARDFLGSTLYKQSAQADGFLEQEQ